MTRPHFTDDFKIDAIKQITERGYSVADVSTRFRVSTHSLYACMKRFSKPPIVAQEAAEQSAEIRRLKRKLIRVTEERDSLKKGHRVLRQGCIPLVDINITCRSVNEVHVYSLTGSVLRSNVPRGDQHRPNFLSERCADACVFTRVDFTLG